MADAVLGAVVAVLWLLLPGMTTGIDAPVAIMPDRPVAGAPAQVEEDETSPGDLVLPLVAVGAAAVLAAYGYIRRTRRARTRTTPGGAPVQPPWPQLAGRADRAQLAGMDDLDQRARQSLVEVDDCVRTSREELGFVEDRFGAAAVEPFARALREAEAELAAAFRMRQRYDEGVPADETARRQVLAGIVGRCGEAGRRLDREAVGLDQLRGLERDLGAAVAVAEARFRELAARTGDAEVLLAELGERYAPYASAPVTGHVEQAKDRLVFATARLNQARQCADLGDPGRAARHLRAAEGAIAQAAVFVGGVGRLATELSAATAMVPAALTGAETEIAGARQRLGAAGQPTGAVESPVTAGVPAGELRARVRHADVVLAGVREELTGGPYDPLDALRRIARAVTPLAAGRAGVLPAAALLVARGAAADAGDFVTTHRGAVGCASRTRLAEAERLLAPPPSAPPERGRPQATADLLAADTLARQARDLAEQDVRLHGTPLAGAAGPESGAAGAVLGGILLGEGEDEGEAPDGGPPLSYGGPHTRARHAETP